MGWLIIHVEPRLNDTKKRRDCEPRIASLAARHSLRDPGPAAWKMLASRHGFDVTGPLPRPHEHAGWPLIAYIYTSRRKDGVGRVGSQLRRLPCRRAPDTE